ncbi:uncharacterized protein LOC126370416 [Pectinophora gossypiella]|uniref:uncharacterized protein LOC126370416 n=1 Tax=Pectinophora gossypiella TaxID=13191 RepID=UPI00214E66CB|nr:uncharacterized protein LOC126370416 [Pectinophora gossypiella]
MPPGWSRSPGLSRYLVGRLAGGTTGFDRAYGGANLAGEPPHSRGIAPKVPLVAGEAELTSTKPGNLRNQVCCFIFLSFKVINQVWFFLSVPAQFIPGRTGAGLLILNGFTFYMKNHQAHGKKQWYCSSRDVHGCRADVITYKGIYYLPSHRTGSMVLIFKDNKYWINNRYQNTINWTCRDRKRLGCNSCIQTTVEGRYIKHKGFHNHEDNYTKYNFND